MNSKQRFYVKIIDEYYCYIIDTLTNLKAYFDFHSIADAYCEEFNLDHNKVTQVEWTLE